PHGGADDGGAFDGANVFAEQGAAYAVRAKHRKVSFSNDIVDAAVIERHPSERNRRSIYEGNRRRDQSETLLRFLGQTACKVGMAARFHEGKCQGMRLCLSVEIGTGRQFKLAADVEIADSLGFEFGQSRRAE